MEMQKFAAAALAEAGGALSAPTASLARLGGGGRYPHNMERDLGRHMRRHCEAIEDLEPWAFKMTFKKPQQLGTDARTVYTLLPHEVFSALHTHRHHRFTQMFGDDHRRAQYWEESKLEQWYQEHPDKALFESCPHLCTPLSFHGDDIAVRRGLSPLSAMIGSLSSPCSWHQFDAVFLLFCMVLKLMTEDALEFVYKIMAWSFDALAGGKWPKLGPDGRPLTGWRAAKAGQWLAPCHGSGLRGFFTALLGDLKFLKEALRLPYYYNKNAICHICTASKDAVDYFGDFTSAAYSQSTVREQPYSIQGILVFSSFPRN